MASVLVPVTEVVTFLGDVSGTDTAAVAALETLIDQVEAAFLAACGRPDRPFAAAATVTEVHDGTGTATLWLDRPVVTLTSLVLGLDTTDPDDTLAVDDKTIVAWQTGSARLRRADGGIFGCLGVPDYVHVTYAAAADLPEDAALAITRAVATVWRQMGSEDATTERIGPYDATFAAVTRDDPLWASAVAAHRLVHV